MPARQASATTGAYASVVEAIGHTPLVEIPRLSPNPRVRLLAKLEGQNPTGSVKDRVARYLVEDLERGERLGPESVVLEPSSGNLGISLAMLCRRNGYPLVIVMPDNVSRERRQVLELYGARIVDSPGSEGANGAVRLAREMARQDPHYVMPDQYANRANPLAHYETTGAEIVADCPEVDVFVAGLGTGGTLMGAGRRLREHNPDVRIVAVEPMPGERVQGLRSLEDGFVPEIFDPRGVDAKFLVSTAESIVGLRELTRREGIFAGVSSGGVVAIAARVAEQMASGTVVALLADGGWKYLSENVWTRDLADESIEELSAW